jgi:hypothetical protein
MPAHFRLLTLIHLAQSRTLAPSTGTWIASLHDCTPPSRPALHAIHPDCVHCTAIMQRCNNEYPSMSPPNPALAPIVAAPAPILLSPTLAQTTADLLGRVLAVRDLDQQTSPAPSWLWHGYLAPGQLTLLTSQWKSGKTTLLALLLARLQHGGQLLGLPVARAKALVISEESLSIWRPRLEQLNIRDHVHLLCRPFPAQPTLQQWLALMDTAAAMRDNHGTDLVVLDSLAPLLPAHAENSASALLECLTPLQRLATTGMDVLLMHHPAKGKLIAGQAARGSGALAGFVDIIIEMGYYAKPDDLDRRRRLVAFSRHEETPRHLVIELEADGTDYVVLQEGIQAAFGENWQAVLDVLASANSKLTRQEILEQWSPDYDKPDGSTLWRWLNRAVVQGIIRREGKGRPQEPFRYWVPERQQMLRPDGGTWEEMKAWNQRQVAELFERLELPSGAEPAPAVPSAEGAVSPPPEAAAATSTTPLPLESMSPQGPEQAPSPLLPDPQPPQAGGRGAVPPEPPVQLPYPFCDLDPADVPSHIWQQARDAQRKN